MINMERFFNTAGAINREDHYNIDPLSRIELDTVLSLIKQKKLFVLHAPRQTGKTSYLYLEEDGRLNMDKLLTAFRDFFRKHFESWVDGFDYAEAGPQLLLQAFLQRIVNSGGRVEREYGLGVSSRLSVNSSGSHCFYVLTHRPRFL